VIRLAVDGDYLFAHSILYQKLMVMSSGGHPQQRGFVPLHSP
jgi:hypothetical protein